MATNAAAVTVATTGTIRVAPWGTALPTSVAATPNAAFLDIGYISEDGVVESQGTSSNKIKAWQNGDTVREVQTEHDLTYKFAALEVNPVVLKQFYGNYTVEINGLQPVSYSWILDLIDGNDAIRIVMPYAQVSDRDDTTYSHSDPIAYGMTLTAYADPNYSGSLAAPAKGYRYDLTDFAS
jgi:hypothetical protein